MAYSPRRGRQTRGLNAGTHRLENNASPVRLRERARSESSVFQAPAKLHSVPPASVSAGFEGPNGRSARETGEPEENPAYSTIRNPNSLFQVASQRPNDVGTSSRKKNKKAVMVNKKVSKKRKGFTNFTDKEIGKIDLPEIKSNRKKRGVYLFTFQLNGCS